MENSKLDFIYFQPEVFQAIAGNDFIVYAYMNDGSIRVLDANNKAIIKTKGIDTKTSGTMTLTIGVLTNVLNKCLEKEGVLYSACEMGFFEEVIFKEKNISKFIELVDTQALKISTINPFSCDELLIDEISKIKTDLNEA